MLLVVQDGLSRPRLYRPARPRVLHTRPPRSIPHNEPIALRQLQRRHPHQPPRYQSGALLLHELCRRVQPRGCITDLTPEDVRVFGESFLQGADAQLPPERATSKHTGCCRVTDPATPTVSPQKGFRSPCSSCSFTNGSAARSPTAAFTTALTPITSRPASSKPPTIAPTKPFNRSSISLPPDL